MNIITEVNRIANIPSLLFYEESSRKNPLVLIVHGFNNDKYEGTKIALKLAQKGFSVLCFDIDKHGDRYEGFMERIDSDVSFGNALFTILENTSNDIDNLIKAVGGHMSVDSSRIGLIGISHGANICNYYISKNDIASCVSMLGSPNFIDLMVYAMEKESVDDFVTAEESKMLDFVGKLNPYERLKVCKTPLFLINASKDDNVPFVFSETLYKECSESSDIEFELEDEYHFVSNSMIDKAIKWTINKML